MSAATQPKAKAKAKKTASAKKPLSHPTFAEMVTDAIVSLKERTGSSQYAITKFIESKYKELPPTFKKLILHHLKKSVAAGKLVKVKNSFKLAPTRSAPAKAAAPTTIASAATKKRKPVAKPNAKPSSTQAKTKPKAKAVTKLKAKPAKATAVKKVVAKPKPKPKPARKTPVKGVKKPKSVKSPAKKAKK